MKLLLFIFIAYGIAQIIVESYILHKFRMYIQSKSLWLYALITCMMCVGFWAGLILSITVWSPAKAYFDNIIYSSVLDGFLTSAIVWLVSCWEQSLSRTK